MNHKKELQWSLKVSPTTLGLSMGGTTYSPVLRSDNKNPLTPETRTSTEAPLAQTLQLM